MFTPVVLIQHMYEYFVFENENENVDTFILDCTKLNYICIE